MKTQTRMLSRVADSLFWLGRYLERAENYARFIDVNFNLCLDLPPGVMEQWEPLITTTGDREHFYALYDKSSRENAIRFLAFDERNENSIISSVRKGRENARIVRENISKEVWEECNDLFYTINKMAEKQVWKNEDQSSYFKKIKNRLQLIFGIAHGTAQRTQGWYFTQLGQYLERADKTSRVLDVKYHFMLPSTDEVGSPLDFLHWAALLKSVSGYNAYRKFYGNIDPGNIVHYLVLNKFFPRSVLFCLMAAEECLHEISEFKGSGYSNKVEKSIGNLRADLEFADIADVFEFGPHEYLDNLQIRMNNISSEIHEQYFRIKPKFTSQVQNQS